MASKVQRAKRTVEEKIPALLIGPNHTTSCALHSIGYIGPLLEWTTFEQDVNSSVGPPGPHNIAREHLLIGDETGVQGRFNQNVGHVMSAVFGSQSIRLRFGDFKSTNSTYRRIPDVAIMDHAHNVHVVGELKTPWVDNHKLNGNPLQDHDAERLFRDQIGQLARYMRDLGLRYGFYSTYNQHVFLSQEFVAGRWSLRYSPVISDTMASQSALTVRQCFFFLRRAAGQTGHVDNRTPASKWVNIGDS